MRVRLHADDFGVSRGVTDGILAHVDSGVLTSLSVIPNGAAFAYAMDLLRARPHVAVSVHLNLIEGNALTTGRPLRHTFGGVLARGVDQAIRDELTAQVRRVQEALDPARPLRLDSHGHLHHIPSVFAVVRDLAKEHGASLRLVREPFFLASGQTASGVVKHVLLNRLSSRLRPRLDGVPVDDWFVGVLHTGRMTADVVSLALAKLPRDASVEVLFHPGAAVEGEEHLWAGQRVMHDYYFSSDRRREGEVLASAALREVVSRYATAP